MKAVVEKAYAKVNLGLDVLGRRDDGYHEVKMIMQTVDLYDTLEISTGFNEGGITIETSDEAVPDDPTNLAYRAAELVRNEYDLVTGLHIKIDKRIPVAAGMAGGSSDAAAVLRGINSLLGLGASDNKLKDLGKKLGADVPFCISGGCMLSEGIGEILTPVRGLSGVKVLLAKPAIGVSTKWVYDNLELAGVTHPDIDAQIKALENGDAYDVCRNMGNVLESVTIGRYPVIEDIKKVMTENGAEGAMMSGSGPTVFGIFKDGEKADMAYESMKESRLAKDIILTGTYNRPDNME